jgi:hypothetical protein
MKKLLWILTLLAALAPALATAQTKEETEKWILTQTDNNTIRSLSYKIENGEWIRKLEPFTMIGDGKTTKNTIQIKDIKTVSALHTEKFMSFEFTCPEDCTYSVTTNSSDKFVSDEKGNRFLFEIYGKLDASMLPRMQKAILRLIELNGGKAKMVAYQKPKEAF